MGKAVPPKPTILPFKLVQQHVTKCRIKEGRCGLCVWALKKEYWRRELQTSWPQVCLKGKVARLGCAACASAGLDGPWATFGQSLLSVRLHHLKRHQSSKAHQIAVEAQGKNDGAHFAPDMSIFKEALQRMRSGGSARDNGTCSDKKHQVRWCLSEASLELSRATLRDALSIAITRDERKGRLLLRWRACTPDFRSSSGVLGFLPVEGFADNLAGVTKKAIQTFCSPRVGLPRGFVEQKPAAMDTAVETSIKRKTSILVTDAAAAELLASGLLSGRRPYAETGCCEDYLPSVRVVGRDAPHATTRLIKRPFAASVELNQIMDEFVSGQEAFAQKVFHSPLYTGWWKELIAQGGGGPTSLSAAKHRFGSFLMPLSRVVDNLSQVIALCHKIAVVRGSPGEWASKLLIHFSGKKAILLGMAADAAATSCDLTRSVDDETADISELSAQLEHWAHSIEALFLSEKVLDLPTYTKKVCDALADTPLQILHQGQAREVRITDNDKRYALTVMKAGRGHRLKNLIF